MENKKATVFARIDPEVKQRAELILDQLGVPMASAIGIFLRQVIMQRGLPFEVRLPSNQPLSYGAMTSEQFDLEMEHAFGEMATGAATPAADVAANLREEYGL